MRAFAGDYLVYLVRESPKHRDGTENRLFTDRTILRGPSAYGYGSIWRWRRYVNACDDDHPVFGIWQRLYRVTSDKFTDELPQLLANRAFNSRLRQQLRTAQPASMVELARAYGSTLERCYTDWQKQLEEDPAATAFADESPRADPANSLWYGRSAGDDAV